MRVGVAALAAAAALLGSVAITTGSANAATGLTPFSGVTVRMSPLNGSSGTNFALNFTTTATGLATSATCPGDAAAGWAYSAFIVPANADIGALTFSGTGSPIAPTTLPSGTTASQFRTLSTPTGTAFAGQNPGAGTFDINPPSGLWLGNLALAAGQYQVGVACYDGNAAVVNETGRFFATPITITSSAVVPVTNPQGYTYQFGVAPSAPVLTGGAVTATTATLSFTQPNSTPASTYTAQVTPALPAGGTAVVSGVVVGATSTTGTVTLSGAATNQSYSVTVAASNAVLPNGVSNIVSVIPIAAPQPAITPAFTPGVGNGTVTIPAVVVGTPAARTAVPTSYTLTVSPAPTGSTAGVPNPPSFTISFVAGPITQVVNGLAAGTVYTFSLAPTYVAPNAGPTTTVTGSPNSAQVVQQRITVVRPVGQLILTQRCGVNGTLPTVAGTNAFPGFPGGLLGVPASNQVGSNPDITPATLFPNGGVPADSVTPDPQFNNYPFPDPATYPTECGVTLGTAKIITGGTNLDGQYFAADGFINEVTISDLRDLDSGWEVRGQMSNFTGSVNSATNVVSGNYLGWTPYVQNFTAPIAGGYGGQLVTAGAQVLPGTGVTAATTGQGLGSGRRLAQAAPNAGLGVAQMDARLRMLIPATAKNDTYVGILNFTVLDNGNGTAP